MYLFDKNGKLAERDLKDIHSIERWDRETMFRIGADHYCPPSTLIELSEVYNRFGFYQIDRKTLLNLKKVTQVQGNKFYIGNHGFTVTRRNQLGLKNEFDK